MPETANNDMSGFVIDTLGVSLYPHQIRAIEWLREPTAEADDAVLLSKWALPRKRVVVSTVIFKPTDGLIGLIFGPEYARAVRERRLSPMRSAYRRKTRRRNRRR